VATERRVQADFVRPILRIIHDHCTQWTSLQRSQKADSATILKCRPPELLSCPPADFAGLCRPRDGFPNTASTG
jgi:hypothetical protein